ncbi:30S ribosomal protein S7 [Candidatus Gottesmanbacteria bacterium RIFCSPHIGHO2_01_FULL_42_12]|uniref:Small ribosomal subunit protein uS7 n=1 Tax=Candidatus Gottesmanbacteria bacterium RIFCSPHIGHO2_01_FULL_42_12 TaxID=1798377 RepID=A0A1F5Z558_9BACT|nr:MAG: 30S ribosomal protein S7 [Candidatus Gottesmanbacteria bacterium RIFCSPHIGHO2_01_FULL_42_12]
MPRSKKVKKIVLEGDPIYNSRALSKFINKVMYDGQKQAAAKEVYRALDLIKVKFPEEEAVKIFEGVLAAIAPKMEVRSRRVGGASYMVPSEVRGERKNHLAMRWLIDAARAKSNKEFHTFGEKLAAELTDAKNGVENAIKKRDNVIKMAEANKAFSHLRW